MLDAQVDTGTLTIVTNGGTVDVTIATVDLDPEVQFITTPPGQVEGQTTTVELTDISGGQAGRVVQVVQSIGAVPLTIDGICFLDGDGECVAGNQATGGVFTLCDGTPDDFEACEPAGTDTKLRAQETYTFSVVFHPPAEATDTFVAQILVATDAGQDPTATLLVRGTPCVRGVDSPICGTCGDGVIDGGEECDDGNLESGDDCLNNCLQNVCGDGIVDATQEECDDANDVDTDACTSACAIAVCGDNLIRDGVEACDDGNDSDTDDCVGPTCQVAFCGDGFVRADGEECDDGNDDDGDGCDADCAPEVGFLCEGAPNICESECGDGILASDEECDDGNTDVDDGCSDLCAVEIGFDCTVVELRSFCASTCGDGIVAADEECDDRNTEDLDGCSAECDEEFGFDCEGVPSICESECGDGEHASDEPCDDGDLNSNVVGNACREDCTLPTCGDGVLDDAEPFGEECDEELNDSCICRPDCTMPVTRDDNLLVSNVSALRTHGHLQRIRGNLVVRNISAQDFEEVLSVECVDGDLSILENGMTDLAVLPFLGVVRGSITISRNGNLVTVEGMDALNRVGVVDRLADGNCIQMRAQKPPASNESRNSARVRPITTWRGELTR